MDINIFDNKIISPYLLSLQLSEEDQAKLDPNDIENYDPEEVENIFPHNKK